MKYLYVCMVLFGFLLSCNKEEAPDNGKTGTEKSIEENEWKGTIVFYYRGERYASRYYLNKDNLNRPTLEDKEANELYSLLCWVLQTVIKITESDGVLRFYDKSPGGLPTDEEGYATFYFGEKIYKSRFWYDKNWKIVFEEKEANDVYLSICDLPNFGTLFTNDGTVIFYTDFIFPHIFD